LPSPTRASASRPGHQHAVFEEFRQVGGSDTKAEGPVWDSLCRKFVELHGGRIGVKSQAGDWFDVHVHDPGATWRMGFWTAKALA
jgi:signal transduction histidine kinase